MLEIQQIPNRWADFFVKYADRFIPEPNSGCWLWTAGGTRNGYGLVSQKHVQYYAHRCAFESVHGDGSADGLVVRHKCDTPACVNPGHLLLGTPLDNTTDMWERNRGRPAFGERVGNSKLTNEQVIEIRRSVKAGETTVAVAGRYGVSPQNINDIVTGQTWKHLPILQTTIGNPRGERNGTSKLTEAMVIEIRRLIGTMRNSDIGEKFGVSKETVQAISSGRNWGWLTAP